MHLSPLCVGGKKGLPNGVTVEGVGGGGGGIPIGRQSLEVGRKGGEVQNWEDTMHVPVSMQKT